MKNILKLLLLLSWMIGMAGCQKDDDIRTEDYFTPPELDSVFFNVDEGEQTLTLHTNLFITPEVQEQGADWCQVEFMPIPARVVVRVQPNPDGETRAVSVLLKTDLVQYPLYIRQLGHAPAIELLHDTYRVSNGTSLLRVPFVTNVKADVKPLVEWVQLKGIAEGKQNDTLLLEIASTPEIRRLGDVELTYGTEIKEVLHIIQQSADTVFHPAAPEGLIKKVQIARAEASDVSYYHGEVQEVFDGDSYSGWSCGNETFPVDFTCYFENAEQIDKMVYESGYGYGPLQQFEIYYKTKGDTEFKKYNEIFDFKGKVGSSQIVFKESILRPEAIRIHVLNGKFAGEKQYATIAELNFYSFSTEQEDIFTDETCSALKEGVTAEQIMLLGNEYFRNLALHLLAGTYDTLSRVQQYQAYMEPDIQSEEYKTSAYSFLDNATGIYIREGEEVVLLVGPTHGVDVSAVVMDWKKMNHNDFTGQKKNGCQVLNKGVNIFTAKNEGLLYIVYNTPNYKTIPPVKVNITSGEVNGYFDIARQNNEDWVNLLNQNNPYEFVDVKGKQTHLVFPFDDFRALCPDNVERLLEVSDSVALLEHELSGYYKYNRMYPNRMFCRLTYETGNFLAFATSYHTAYIPGATGVICDAAKLRKECWAMAHELGHCHQVPGFKWHGMTEVSNNVFSLHVQTTFGEESRLQANNYYQTGYNTVAVPGIAHCECEDVFTKLVPFWQLQLYFGKVAGQKDFYAGLYEYFRTHTTPATAAETQMEFVRLCCEKGNKDLTAFFEFWGLLKENPEVSLGFPIPQSLVEQTRNAIAGKYPPALAIQYLTDANIDLFRKNVKVQEGQAHLDGSNLKMTGWENVVAYEVYEGNKLIQVSLASEFTLNHTSGVTVKAIAADGTATAVAIQ